MSLDFRNEDLRVSWCGGGVLVATDRTNVLFDCPPGVEQFLPCRGAEVDALILTSGRSQSVGGLVSFLTAASHFRRGGRRLSIYAIAGEERGPALVECWQRFWRGGLDVELDVNVPGRKVDVGETVVQVQSITHGEPDFGADAVVPALGGAVLLRSGRTRVVWIPGAAPQPRLEHLCRDVDLAVVEVGIIPWPAAESAWRLDAQAAARAAAQARCVWLVDDEGRRLSSALA